CEIDRDPRWHKWLMEPDEFTGRPRQLLLNEAIARGDAYRVRAFFHGFQQAAGGAQATPATSSKRTRSALSNKPIYTREQIKSLYEMHKRGADAGREAEWNGIEEKIIKAGGEGGVAAPPYLTK